MNPAGSGGGCAFFARLEKAIVLFVEVGGSTVRSIAWTELGGKTVLSAIFTELGGCTKRPTVCTELGGSTKRLTVCTDDGGGTTRSTTLTELGGTLVVSEDRPAVGELDSGSSSWSGHKRRVRASEPKSRQRVNPGDVPGGSS